MWRSRLFWGQNLGNASMAVIAGSLGYFIGTENALVAIAILAGGLIWFFYWDSKREWERFGDWEEEDA